MTLKTRLRIGTRRSKLALTQSEIVKARLEEAHPELQVELVPMATKGDWTPEQGEVKLEEKEGGKALWVVDIEEALRKGEIDCAVHSMKDVPTFLHSMFKVSHVLPREDARDTFISFKYNALEELPLGSVIGTSSARRKAVLKYVRPDIEVTTFRGNIDTRLAKLKAGQVDAIILAAAGLKRLGLESMITEYLSAEDMLPSACQGIVGIETRKDDLLTTRLLDEIHCTRTGLIAHAERAVLEVLDGSCATPIGAYAQFTKDQNKDKTMRLRAFVACPEGHALYAEQILGNVTNKNEAVELGQKLGRRLRSVVPVELLSTETAQKI